MKKESGLTALHILENIGEAIYTLDEDWRITYANKKAKRLLSRSGKQFLGKIIWEAFPETKKWKSYDFLHEARKKNKRTVYDLYSPIVKEWIEVNALPHKKGLLIHFRTITYRKHLESSLKSSRDQLRIILQNIADGITVQDKYGKLIYANKAAILSNGYKSLDEMLQAPPLDYIERFSLFDEQDKPFPSHKLPGRRAIAGEKNPSVMLKFVAKKTGEARWVKIKSTASYDDEGQTQLVINVMHDMTREKEIEQRKDDFISMASHELKTPLTTIKAFVEVLLMKSSVFEGRSLLEKVNRQIDKLTELVNELLDITKIQQGKLSMQREKFAAKELIQEVVENMQVLTSQKFVLKVSPALFICGDKERIGQVITNFVSNAIKYSPKAEEIIITAKKDKKNIIISVTDFGIGMTKKIQEKIFERFYRAEEGEKTYPGLGLGLYISSEIIRKHKGKLWVESKVGKGSTFSFSIPC